MVCTVSSGTVIYVWKGEGAIGTVPEAGIRAQFRDYIAVVDKAVRGQLACPSGEARGKLRMRSFFRRMLDSTCLLRRGTDAIGIKALTKATRPATLTYGSLTKVRPVTVRV